MATPEGARSWLRMVLEFTDKATSATLFFMLLTGGLMGYYLLKELGRTRTMNTQLWERLLIAEKHTIELAWRCTTGGEKR